MSNKTSFDLLGKKFDSPFFWSVRYRLLEMSEITEMTEEERLMKITYGDIVHHKKITNFTKRIDFNTLENYSALINERKFCGNKILYHYMTDELCKTKPKSGISLFEIMNDPVQKKKLVEKTIKLGRTGTDENRLFEASRFNGAIVFFKPATAKFIYKKFGATCVLDPCMGWGGRLLGAVSLGIRYVGFDTNKELEKPYDAMTNFIMSIPGKSCSCSYTFQSCMDADFAPIDYDFVLTSPPYINLERYSHMTPFESDAKYYKEFLIPLINKCLAHIKRNGWVCFNINQKMYKDLKAYGMRPADQEENFLQQKKMGKDMADMVYCWRNNSV